MAANPKFKVNKFKYFVAQATRPLVRMFGGKFYVSLQYRYVTGRKLHWKTLERYTEKLQYLRLYHFPFNNEVVMATSRIGARIRVARLDLADILIPLLGIYHDANDIDFATLPNKFVIKATHGCALNYICTDKRKLNFSALRKMLNKWLVLDYGKKTVEPHYSKIRPGLIIEQYVGETTKLPTEYKIHVFNGKARYLYVVSDRGADIRYDNFYIDYTPFDEAQFNDWDSSDVPPEKPAIFETLVKMAETLAHDFAFCRVDFFVVNNNIYFNEFTFTPAKGTLRFAKDEADFIIGKWLELPSAK